MLTPADFEGHWNLHRTIEDRYAGQMGDFRGSALFRAEADDHLAYFETGMVRFGAGPVMKAERRYHWRFDGNAVDVRFADGAAFHRFTPTGVGAGTDHPCGDDFYTVQYDFTAWPDWTATWTVTGPRKDYTSTSKYNGHARPQPMTGSPKPVRQFVVTPLNDD